MGREFRRLRSEEVPSPAHLNLAYAELRRLRGLRTAGGVELSGARGPAPPRLSLAAGERTDVRLTGPYSGGYPWAEVALNAAGVWVPTGRTGGPATGDPAFERRKGDTTLSAGPTVYHAVRSPASNQWVFPARKKPDGVTLNCCPGVNLPATLHASERFWGQSFTLTWDPTAQRYAGYFQFVMPVHSATPCCGTTTLFTVTVWCYIDKTCLMSLQYYGQFSINPNCAGYCCPLPSGPSDPANCRCQPPRPPLSVTCDPFSGTWKFPGGGSGFNLPFLTADETVTVTL